MRSIQWKVVVMFLLLTLLSMELTGWYLLRQLEDYYLGNVKRDVTAQATLASSVLAPYLAEPSAQYIRSYIQEYGRLMGLDVMVMDSSATVISSSTGKEGYQGRQVLLPEVTQAITEGAPGECTRRDPSSGQRVLSRAVPIRSPAGDILGALHVTKSLEHTYQVLDDIKVILLAAALVAMAGSGLLAFLLASTITEPIREITAKAGRLAGGDFDQPIDIRSSDEIGRLASMFNHMADSLKETLRDISSEKSKLDAVLTNMADGVLAFDSDGKIVMVNPRASEILGVGEEELLGIGAEDLLPEMSLGKVVQDALGGEHNLTLRGEVRATGCIVRAHLAPLPGNDPDEPALVLVLQDMTKEEQAEQRRKEFVANASHELKTPLTTIKSYVETLTEGAIEDSEVSGRFLRVVAHETDRMVRLVRDLLDLSAIDSGQMLWETGQFSIPLLVDQACGRMTSAADAKKISLTYGGDSRALTVEGDADRVEQVLLNLIGNAIEYTGAGGQIRVRWRAQDGGVLIAVADDGPGIPAEDLPRIFERFYRVDKARSRQRGGTGLGLAIAKEIVEAHGGWIDIQSLPETGTTVRFWLPATQAEADRAGEPD